MIYIVCTTQEENEMIEQYLDNISTDIRDYIGDSIIRSIENTGYIEMLKGHEFCVVFDPNCNYLDDVRRN